jgi:hypothetical protein
MLYYRKWSESGVPKTIQSPMLSVLLWQWCTQEFCSVVGGWMGVLGQQIQLRTEDRQKGDLGAVVP